MSTSVHDLMDAVLHSLVTVEELTNQKVEAENELEFKQKILWSNDSSLCATISSLKNLAALLSNDCTKFTMMLSCSPSGEQITSLCDELKHSIHVFVLKYIEFSQCFSSKYLLLIVSRAVHSVLLLVKDLIELTLKSDIDNTKSALGKIWSTVQDLEKIPMTNKIAYRRNYLEKLTVIKETAREFGEYIASCCNGKEGIQSSQMYSCDENAEAEGLGFNEEISYDESEVILVTKCAGKITEIGNVLLSGLSDMTKLADSIENSSASPELSETTSPTSQYDELRMSARVWVSKIVDQVDILSDAIIDLGAELYPPIDEIAAMNSYDLVEQKLIDFTTIMNDGKTKFNGNLTNLC